MDARARHAARTVAALYALAWLLPAFVGGYATLTMFPFKELEVPGFDPWVHEGFGRLLVDPWQRWDGQWYLRIAESGYFAHDASAAFLPAFPSTIRALSPLFGGDALVAGCVVSWVAFPIALGLLFRLLKEDIGESDATLSLVLLVTFPTAFFFHAVYTESLFLLLVALTFVAARRKLWVFAGASALAATLTRWTGFALVPALLVEAWSGAIPVEHEGGEAESMWQLMLSKSGVDALRRVSPIAWIGALLPAAAFPIVLRIFDRAVGDPWAFSRAQRMWERHVVPPWNGLIDGARVLMPGHPPYLDPLDGGFPRLPTYGGGFLDAHAYNLVAALGGIWLAVLAFRKLRPSYGVLALAGVIIPLMTPSRLQPLQSMPRFLVVLFPLFAVSALLLRGRPLLTASVIAIGATLQGFFIARFVLWFWVA